MRRLERGVKSWFGLVCGDNEDELRERERIGALINGED